MLRVYVAMFLYLVFFMNNLNDPIFWIIESVNIWWFYEHNFQTLD